MGEGSLEERSLPHRGHHEVDDLGTLNRSADISRGQGQFRLSSSAYPVESNGLRAQEFLDSAGEGGQFSQGHLEPAQR